MKAEGRRLKDEPPKLRFVLSDVAVKRLRAAEESMQELFDKLYTQSPAWIVNEIAGPLLALNQAVVEIDRCNVENAA